MTNEQINLTIAKAHLGVFPWESKKGTVGGWTNDDGDDCEAPPDYCNDLNAMHEAVNCLEGFNKAEFAHRLISVVGKDWPDGISAGSFAHIDATARKRAEAFLRTIGKWEEAAK